MVAGRARREQALELLRRGWPPGDEPRYDPDHALVLCQLAGYRPGLVLLYEAKRLFREVLRVRALCAFLVGCGLSPWMGVPPGPGAAVRAQAPVPGGASGARTLRITGRLLDVFGDGGYRAGLVLLLKSKRQFKEVLRVRVPARPLVGWAVGVSHGCDPSR